MNIRKYREYFLGVIAMMPLLTTGLLSIAIILYASYSIILFFVEKNEITKSSLKYFFGQTCFYFIFALSIFYTENDVDSGLRILQHSLPIFIFPLISILSSKINNDEFRSTIKVFLFSSFCLSAYIVFMLLWTYGFYKVFNTSIVFHMIKGDFFFINVHPIYTSAYFILGSFIIFYDLLKYEIKTIHIVSLLVYFMGIIILASKTAILLLVLGILFLFSFQKGLSYRKKVYFFTIVISVVFILFWNVRTINSRFMDLFNSFNENYRNLLKENSTNIRMEIYSCSISEIAKNFWFGLGIGDVQLALNNCYETNKFIHKSISSHNFFFRIFLSSGVFGVLFFIYSIFSNIKRSVQNKFLLFTLINLLFVSFMMVEDYLIRAYGVTLYAIVNHLLYLKTKKNEFFI